MKIFLEFLKAVGIWTAILLVLLSLIGLVLGQGFAEVLSHWPVWGGLALVLSAFPAGIAVVDDVFPRTGGVDVRAFGWGTASAGTVALVTFVLVAYLGPAAVRGDGSNVAPGEPNAMTLNQLKREAQLAAVQVEQAVGRDGLSMEWRKANILVWHYTRRLAGVAQPLLFAAIGVLTAFWARRLGKRELARVLYWTMGLFLVVSTYLAGENGFELVVLQSAGPVFFVGLFVLIIPPALVLGLGIPTAVLLWTGESKILDA